MGQSLDEKVQKLLDEGWKLHGGVGVGHGGGSQHQHSCYAQAMVRGKISKDIETFKDIEPDSIID